MSRWRRGSRAENIGDHIAPRTQYSVADEIKITIIVVDIGYDVTRVDNSRLLKSTVARDIAAFTFS